MRRITCCLLTSVKVSRSGAGDISCLSTWAGPPAESSLLSAGFGPSLYLECDCGLFSAQTHTCLCGIGDTGLYLDSSLSVRIDLSSTTSSSCFICMTQLTPALRGYYVPISWSLSLYFMNSSDCLELSQFLQTLSCHPSEVLNSEEIFTVGS